LNGRPVTSTWEASPGVRKCPHRSVRTVLAELAAAGRLDVDRTAPGSPKYRLLLPDVDGLTQTAPAAEKTGS
jgi:hypothetical protein